MEKILIYPDRLRQFGNADNNIFCLISNPNIIDNFFIEKSEKYKQSIKLCIESHDDFIRALSELPDGSHILVISPYCLIQSVSPDKLSNKKLLIFACNSAPTSLEAINYFLRAGEKTDPLEQETITFNFFNNLELEETLVLYDKKYQTKATFNHLLDDYGWHEQCGMLEWGQQQVFPAGEIACFLVPLKATEIDFSLRMEINGEIPLMGYPVLHSGPPSFLLTDQERIYQKLSTIKKHAVIAKITRGEIVDLIATDHTSKPAEEILKNMFLVDSRFRTIYEIGFAINYNIKPFEANNAMNEVSSGKDGTIHFGIGMLPYTQYHLDIVCPNLTVLGKNEKFIFGKKNQKLNRIKSSQCPCLGYS